MHGKSMTDWDHIWRLFYEAMELSGPELTAWWSQRTDVSADQRLRLQQLLRAHHSTDSMLDHPLNLQRELLHAGSILGSWQIKRLLARGGYGEVYLASRCDGEFERTVAIKVFSPLIVGKGSRENFLGEQKILASLDHPGIVRLLDAGHSEQGLMYLVMEYVAGTALLEHCRQQQPDLHSRLALFEQICTAVDYAHRQLVVHCDLHPGNIMVCPSASGWQTKLLDFGVSRLITTREACGLRGFTPEYASPEQYLQQALGTATDVFAAGVILSVLLTGQTPFAANASDQASYLRAVQQGPLPLSELQANDGSGSGRSERQLPRELDWIKDRCLGYRPQQRYPGMQALLHDLRCLRRHYPVQARPVGTLYRLRKYLRRHWRWVAPASMGLLLLSALTLRLYQEQQHTRQALRQSEQQRLRAQATVNFLASLFDQADRTRQSGDTADAVTMLARGWQQLQQDQTLDAELKLPLIIKLSEIYSNLGAYDRALQLARQGRELAADSADSEAMLAADLAIGKIQFLAGQLQSSVATLESAVREIRRDPAPTLRALQVDLLLALGTSLQHLGELPRAGESFQQAATLSADHKQASADADSVLQHAEVLLRLGSWNWSTGQLEQARDYYLQALQVHETLTRRHMPELARAVDAYASALYALGDHAHAAEQFQRAIAIRRQALGDQHRLTADSLSNLGAVYYELGDDHGAVEVLQEALQIYQQLGFDRHQAIGKILNNLGLVKLRLGLTDEAIDLLTRSLAIHVENLGERHVKVAGNLNNLGLAAEWSNHLDRAQSHYERALQMQQALLGNEHPATAVSLVNLARMAMFAQHHEQAQQLFDQAWSIIQKAHGDDSVNLASVLFWWGIMDCATERRELALQRLQRAYQLRVQHGPQHPDTILARGGLAACRLASDQLSVAMLAQEQRHWLALQLRLPPPQPWPRLITAMTRGSASTD